MNEPLVISNAEPVIDFDTVSNVPDAVIEMLTEITMTLAKVLDSGVLSGELASVATEVAYCFAKATRYLHDLESEDTEIGDGMTDAEADANALASAGWGTDEDYE